MAHECSDVMREHMQFRKALWCSAGISTMGQEASRQVNGRLNGSWVELEHWEWHAREPLTRNMVRKCGRKGVWELRPSRMLRYRQTLRFKCLVRIAKMAFA
eukprot:scaffold38801_cov19-Tisochrysis_lutea.AAC.1